MLTRAQAFIVQKYPVCLDVTYMRSRRLTPPVDTVALSSPNEEDQVNVIESMLDGPIEFILLVLKPGATVYVCLSCHHVIDPSSSKNKEAKKQVANLRAMTAYAYTEKLIHADDVLLIGIEKCMMCKTPDGRTLGEIHGPKFVGTRPRPIGIVTPAQRNAILREKSKDD